MDELLDIVVTGFEVDDHEAETGLVRVFKMDAPSAQRFVRELPKTAKRGADRKSAERYAAALRTIGAQVELRPAAANARRAADPSGASLPAPTAAMKSLASRAIESQRVERAADDVIARFRASEGLDSDSLPSGFDQYNPTIPKAPPIPDDLTRLGNAPLPRMSEPPSWVVTDKQGMLDVGFQSGGVSSDRLHAQRPPPAGTDLSPTTSRPPRYSGPQSITPGAVGVARATGAAGRPGMSLAPEASPTKVRSVVERSRALWPVALVAVALYVLHRLGVF